MPEPVCPECGTAFDPSDATTFIQNPVALRRHRRNRWIKRVTVALVIGGLLYVLVPRRMLRGDMTFTCADCGYKVRIERTEPQSVRWLPFRFPGSVETEIITEGTAGNDEPCDHRYSATCAVDLAIGGKASATIGVGRPGQVRFAGLDPSGEFLHLTSDGLTSSAEAFTDESLPATPENAGKVLHMLMGTENTGIVSVVLSISIRSGGLESDASKEAIEAANEAIKKQIEEMPHKVNAED